MTTTRASTLVTMASNDCIMIYTVIVGDEDGPPLWVQCTAHGDDDFPATRTSVVRAQGEDCRALWARVIDAVRKMKLTRGLQHQVLVRCMTTPPPADPQQRAVRPATAFQHDAPALKFLQHVDATQHRRFARSGRADNGNDLTFLHGAIDPFQHFEGPILFV